MIAIKVPVLAESVSEAAILNWHKQVGDLVENDDILAEIETDKVVLEVTAPASGQLSEILKKAGDLVTSSTVIAHFIEQDLVSNRLSTAANKVSPSSHDQDATKTSPAVRHMTAQSGVDHEQIPHQADRITKTDVLHYQQQNTTAAAKSTASIVSIDNSVKSTAPKSAVDNNSDADDQSQRPEQRVPMTRLRRSVSRRLLSAQHEHAILTTFNEVNMRAIIDLRQQYKADFLKQHDAKLGFMSFFIKATVAALKAFPIVNASIIEEDIVYHGYYDIGIAVSSPRGLVVPVLRDVDQLSFSEIEQDINHYAQRAKQNKLALADLQGGTFSITNGGIFGSMLSTPILNPPQSAILGMHNIVERPVAEQGQVVIRPIMYVALSYDHRLIDGREAVQFLNTIKQSLDDPARLLLEL